VTLGSISFLADLNIVENVHHDVTSLVDEIDCYLDADYDDVDLSAAHKHLVR